MESKEDRNNQSVVIIRWAMLFAALLAVYYAWADEYKLEISNPVFFNVIETIWFLFLFALTWIRPTLIRRKSQPFLLASFYFISIHLNLQLYMSNLNLASAFYLLLVFISIPAFARIVFKTTGSFLTFSAFNILLLLLVFLNVETPQYLPKKPDELLVVFFTGALFTIAMAFISIYTSIKTEKLLLEEERRFGTVMEGLAEGMLITDRHGKVIYVNRKTVEMTGFSRSELVGSTTQLLMPALRKYNDEINLESETGDIFEMEFTRKDASSFFLEVHASPWINSDGSLSGVVGALTDISRRKEDEAALIQSEAQLRAVWESAPLPMAVINAACTRFLAANRPFEALLNENGGALLLTNPQLRDILNEMEYKYLVSRREITLESTSGILHLAITLRRMHYDNEEAVLAVFYDMTQRVEAERELAAERNRLAALISTVPCTISWISPELIYTAVNPAMCASLGMSETEIVGKNVGFTSGENGPFASFIREFFQGGSTEGNAEMSIAQPDGSKREFFFAARRYPGIGELVVAGLDITEKKRLEEQLMLRQRLDSLGSLAGGIAHDFNNLLTGIMGNLSLIDLNFAADLDSAKGMQKFVDSAMKASERAADLIMQIQSLSGPHGSEKKDIDLWEIASEVMTLLDRASDPTVKKNIDFGPGKYFVRINPSELNQVLLNLGTNSIASFEASGVKKGDFINISAANESVSGKAFPSGDYVHVSFMDNGEGMTEETKRKAFDPLFTTRTKGKKKGQGLGLAMVYSIITRNNSGHIEIESEHGKGCTLHLWLPAAKSASPEKKQILAVKKEAPVKHSASSPTILLVDDEEMIIDLGSQILQNMGYNCITAGDGEQALLIYANQKKEIDLVILDLNMPVLHGEEVARQMWVINPNARIIISSGNPGNGINEETTARIRGWIKKPYNMQELTAVLKKSLEN